MDKSIDTIFANTSVVIYKYTKNEFFVSFYDDNGKVLFESVLESKTFDELVSHVLNVYDNISIYSHNGILMIPSTKMLYQNLFA